MIWEICYCFVSSGVTASGVVRVVCACVVYGSVLVWLLLEVDWTHGSQFPPVLSVCVVPPLRQHPFGGSRGEHTSMTFPDGPCRVPCEPLALGAR